MVRMVYSSLDYGKTRLLKKGQLILVEIGRDEINSASGFVDYLEEAYGFSKSSVWYDLNRLKELGLLDFATKESPGRRLSLTKEGLVELGRLGQQKHQIIDRFSREAMSMMSVQGRI